MAGFNLYIGNRMEVLAEQLADVLREPLGDPLRSEIVMVQNRSMERWVSMQLALRHGICANIRFPFPRTFLYEILAKVTENLPEDDYEPGIMTWRILHQMPECLNHPSFISLKWYLSDDPTHLKRYQLAASIAQVFDGYLIFRPEMIMAWEGGESGTGDEAWQAELWRMIRKGCKAGHVAAYREEILRKLRHESGMDAVLPPRIAIFGISTLPRFYLDLFNTLSRKMEINGFFMNPCREFWGDIRSGKETGRMVQRVRERTSWNEVTGEDLYLEEGNSLLASLGNQGRDFFTYLTNLTVEIRESFVEPGEETLLTTLQSDVLNLRDRGGKGIPGKSLTEDDHSLRVHSCHGPLREIEVLHDQLLEMFAEDPGLLPKDILVMAPDIETYTPLIEAMFGAGNGEGFQAGRGGSIPFSIADRTISHGSPLLQAFLAILELHGSRFELSRVLSVLDAGPVQRRFGMDEADAETIRRWIIEAGVRWGIDAEDKERAGLPSFQENTWRAGLDRLLLGYAMPRRGESIFQGIVPYDDLEGKDARILGRFLDFIETLFSEVTALGQARTLAGWSDALSALLEKLFDSSEQEEAEDLRAILRSLEDLRRIGEKGEGGFPEAVDFAVMKAHLTGVLEKTGLQYGYLTGGVTFCALVPMRSIPFQVICLLGMNNADYPRHSREVDFDLMAHKPRPGDRSRRDDDRYLFLEAMLSARKTLYISYCGQSSEDNSVIPPSVLISELLDYLEQGFSEGEKIRDRVLTVHHLQAFHPSYFNGDPKLFSYSEENCRAARALIDPSREAPRFFTGVLPDPEPGWRDIQVADMKLFFRNPAKFLLERRIGISLAEGPELPEDRERFRIEGLDGYLLGQTLLEYALSGKDPLALLPAAMAAGELPHGTAGVCHFEEMCRGVRSFAVSAGPYLQSRRPLPLELDLEIGDFHLEGRIDSLYEGGLIHYRYANLRAADHLRVWIDHLLCQLTETDAFPQTGALLGRDGVWRYAQSKDPRASLDCLLEIYGKGLKTPLPFFPETSLAYAEALSGGKRSEAEALRKAENTWMGNDRQRGEGDDPYIRLCFGTSPPLDREFQETALAVFGPLLRHRERIGR